jgi:hypothetical protein
MNGTTSECLASFDELIHRIVCVPAAPKPRRRCSDSSGGVRQQCLHMMTSGTPIMFAAFITMPCGGNTETYEQNRTVFEVVRPNPWKRKIERTREGFTCLVPSAPRDFLPRLRPGPAIYVLAVLFQSTCCSGRSSTPPPGFSVCLFIPGRFE